MPFSSKGHIKAKLLLSLDPQSLPARYKMYWKPVLITSLTSLLLVTNTNATGLYSKGSSVLQVDGKSYDKLITKSKLVSVGFKPELHNF